MPAFERPPPCWTGPPSAFEVDLMRSFSSPPLEQFRARVFEAVTTTHAPVKSARAILQMAFETELAAALTKLIQVAPDVKAARVCERRRYLEIDADLHKYGFLLDPALQAIEGSIPATYARLLRRYVASGHARYRVSAMCALLCLATATRPAAAGAP